MKVIATSTGYHEGLREKGHEFDVEDGRESPWWVPVGQSTETVASVEPEPTTLSQMGKKQAKQDAKQLQRISDKEL